MACYSQRKCLELHVLDGLMVFLESGIFERYSAFICIDIEDNFPWGCFPLYGFCWAIKPI